MPRLFKVSAILFKRGDFSSPNISYDGFPDCAEAVTASPSRRRADPRPDTSGATEGEFPACVCVNVCVR